jgi:hypothetical protein
LTVIFISGLAALALTAVACGEDDGGGDGSEATTTAEAANAQLCNELNDLGTAIEDLQDLDSESTFTEVDAALSAVEDAWASAEITADLAAAEEREAVVAALQNLTDTIQDIEGTDTLGDAEAEVQAAADEVAQARDDLATSADCS